MSRRNRAKRTLVQPDPIYGSRLVNLLIAQILKSGKKSIAQKVVYAALEIISTKTEENPIFILEKAVKNVTPQVEVKVRRVGGSTYQVPIEVRSERKIALAMRWMIEASRKRGEKGMKLRLAGEVLDAVQNRGTAFKKKEDTHRMADANKAFAHFRW